MMRARTRVLIGVLVMSTLLVLYFVFVGVRAVALLMSGTPIAIIMGIALVVLPAIGVWALCRELFFGYRSTSLVDELAAQGALPDDLGEAGSNGRPSREVADAAFERYRGEAEASPQSWQVWARLGIVFDACGDRKRARRAMREALAQHRNEFGRVSKTH